MAQITLRDYLQETEDAIGAKQIDKALANCQSILAHFPDSLEGQRLLGEVYLAQNRLQDAQHAFDWVLSNDPENVIAYCSRALVSEQLSDYDTALDCYQQAYELSRGNSQIRQAFNRLSEKVDQQGFMLSRAGLARLYMRGDLLAQSIQEWEVVLTAMPDRLDARTGLLEAYWREGLYDQASQLANQILRDVPSCLKALILLAHVTAPQDMLHSQELMKRAEALDPDLVMAHELFADHLANQSRDPFLVLLKKAPVVIGEDVAALETAKGPATPVESPLQEQSFAYASTFGSPSDALATWGNLEGWNSDATLVPPRSNEPDKQTTLSSPTWNGNGESYAGNDKSQNSEPMPRLNSSDPQWSIDATSTVPWSTFQPDMPPAPSPQGNGQPEPWQLLQDALNNIDQEVVWNEPEANAPLKEPASLYDAPHSSQPGQMSHEQIEETAARARDEDQNLESSVFPLHEEYDPLGPPAWLSMLTQTERNQLSGVMPAVNPVEKRQAPQPSISVPQEEPEPVHTNTAWSSSETLDAGVGSVDEEESFFGPDWLKSLGAATLDQDQADEALTAAPSMQISPETVEEVRPREERFETRQEPAEKFQSAPGENSWTASSLTQRQELPKRGSWLDSLGVSSDFGLREQKEQAEPEPPRWESRADRESGPVYTDRQEGLNEPLYGVNTGQSEGSEPEAYDQTPELDEAQRWTAQPQEQPVRSSWLDSLSPPSLEQYEPREHLQHLRESSQPVNAQSQEEQTGDLSWSSGWSEKETAQPSWLSQISGIQSPFATENTSQALSEEQAQTQEKSEQNLVTTLEELEQKLRSHGFIPLEPNSLSSIAQTQGSASSSDEPIHAVPDDTRSYSQEPSLSSALAELGNFVQPAVNEASRVPSTEPSAAVEQTTAEPSWLASLRAVPDASVTRSEDAERSEQEAGTPMETPRYPVGYSAYPETSTFSPTFEPVDAPTTKSQPGTAREATPQRNPLLDSELETTMKRPAVRLQPMQKRALPSRELSSQSRSRATEQAPFSAGTGGTSYRERLLRGYQSQLIGDYDTAMQEYRIIIRNMPELLGEVVSNLRALLKLAPKYSAGYRVLGDAYMRQGEYLQAMEAYNKALTMAKKAKN